MFKGCVLAVGLAAATLASPATAEWAPDGPVTMMVMFPPGGGGDVLARAVANHFEQALGWTVVVDNHPGGGGAALAQALRTQPADGMTIGMAVSETYSFIPLMNPNAGYSADDATFIGSIAETQIGWVARADSPWNSLDDMVAAARAGEEIEVGVFSPRANAVVRAIGQHYGVEFYPVPLQSGAEGITNVINGHLATTLAAGPQAPYVRAGDVKVLVGLASEPLVVGGEAGTILDQGVEVAAFDVYWSFVAPPGLPTEVADAWIAALAGTMDDPELNAFITDRMSLRMNFIPGPELHRLIVESDGVNRELIEFLR